MRRVQQNIPLPFNQNRWHDQSSTSPRPYPLISESLRLRIIMLSPVLRQAGDKLPLTSAFRLFVDGYIDSEPYKISRLVAWV